MVWRRVADLKPGAFRRRAIGLALLGPISHLMVVFDTDNARAIADFHTAFNLVLALIFFPLLRPYAALLQRLLPTRVNQTDPGRPI